VAGEDKTEAPTPKKKREARKKGQIAKSPDITMWAQILVAGVVLKFTVTKAAHVFSDLLDQIGNTMRHPEPGVAMGLFGEALLDSAILCAPLAGAMAVVGVIGAIAQGGVVVNGGAIKPKAERINIAKGLKRQFSMQSVWQATKTLLKTAVLTYVCWGPLWNTTKAIVGVGQPDIGSVFLDIGVSASGMIQKVAVAGLILGALDYAIARRKINKGMRMTKHEVKQEARQSEGDPQMKAQIRSRQQQISRNRMMAAIADSTVVVVNPTHVAVALKYDQATGAPTVVAKGRCETAARIRARAEEHGVPIVRDVPLARAIESTCALGQEIPSELYEAVARLLAFVFTLSRAPGMGGVLTAPAGR
jgi:flagellar biosynthetic protein FlhB